MVLDPATARQAQRLQKWEVLVDVLEIAPVSGEVVNLTTIQTKVLDGLRKVLEPNLVSMDEAIVQFQSLQIFSCFTDVHHESLRQVGDCTLSAQEPPQCQAISPAVQQPHTLFDRFQIHGWRSCEIWVFPEGSILTNPLEPGTCLCHSQKLVA